MNNSVKRNNLFSRIMAVAVLCALIPGLSACSAADKVKASVPAAAAAPIAESVQSAVPVSTPVALPTEEPLPAETPEPDDPSLEKLTDDDGDGIINYTFNYKGATVYILIVLDPSRVFVGTAVQDPSVLFGMGKTLDEMIYEYDAVGGMNAGVFLDDNGTGSGWPPLGITYGSGTCYNGNEYGIVAGISAYDELLAGYYTKDDCDIEEIRDAVSFGPVLIQYGQKVPYDNFEKGVGARTVIAQRADGAIVMMAVDGRQGYSIGLSFADCVDVLYDKFGCVTAINMDGGNSTAMIYDGEYLNNPSNQAAGSRTLPTAWLIRKLPAGYKAPESVPSVIKIPKNALGEVYENDKLCDDELCARLAVFADSFVDNYYGYFGTPNADMYMPALLQYTVPGCELENIIQQTYLDGRTWVNTYYNDLTNKSFNGAYDNGDGTYTILYSLDINELSTYWTYFHPNTQLRITVTEAPDSVYGFYALSTN